MNAVVTGASSGIGTEIARGLVAAGYRVAACGRDPDRTAAVARELGAEPFVADLASMAEVRRLGEDLRGLGTIDVLVHNAGIWLPRRELTADGFERTFATNHLAPFLLTSLLLDVLPDGGRVVTVSSRLHRRGRLDVDDLHYDRRRYGGIRAYAQAKLANVLFASELARREPWLVSNSVHPGDVATRVTRGSAVLHLGMSLVGGAFLLSPEQGARGPLKCALQDVGTGRYFHREREATPSRAGRDEELARRLWDASERLVAP